MDNITEYHCTGCRACEQLCPTHSIKMETDSEGFLHAVVHQDSCIDCGLCQKRCPQNNDTLQYAVHTTLATRLKDDELLYKSASGGAFAGMATHVLRKGGVVFGVAYDDNMVVRHCKAESLEELPALLSSKYVQSDTASTYTEVKQLLQEGRQVLYSGTGCQIAGLRSFLGRRNYPNLVTVDVVCHGVTSPLLFAKYLEYLHGKHDANITEYDFRDKRGGWGLGYKYKYKYRYGSCSLDPYYATFLAGDAYRECCYECKYANTNRSGDITIADYWGIEQFHPSFYNHKGVSLVLLNSDKGDNLWKEVASSFFIQESKLEYAVVKNGNLRSPTKRTIRRDDIYKDIHKLSATEYVVTRLAVHPSLASHLKALLPMSLMLAIKKIMWKIKYTNNMKSKIPPRIIIYNRTASCALLYVEPYKACA